MAVSIVGVFTWRAVLQELGDLFTYTGICYKQDPLTDRCPSMHAAVAVCWWHASQDNCNEFLAGPY